MEAGKIRYYEFGEFRVDTRRRILSKNDDSLPLSPRNFDLLLVLIENEGQILTHDDLLDRVWEGTFVEQANLKNAISVIRKILGEEANEGSFIRTVPRKGYSFVAPVSIPADLSLPEAEQVDPVHKELTLNDGVSENTSSHIESIRTVSSNYLTRIGKYRIGLGLLAIVLLGIFGYLIWQRQVKKAPVVSIENIKIEKLTSSGNLNGAIVSPDGNYFLYAALGNDGASLWVQQIATGSSTRLTPVMQASFWFYTFSPDSNYIYYTVDRSPDAAQNGLFKIPLFGGSAQRIGESAYGFSFSPDGKRIASSRLTEGGTQYVTANPDFTDVTPITIFDGDSRIWSMQWSPDGNSILFAVRKFLGDKTVHYVIEFPATGGEGKIIVPEMDKQISSAVWLPDKSSLLICLREVNAEIRQVWQYVPTTGELRRVTNDDNSYKGLTITRDGKTIVTITENLFASVWVADDDKFEYKQLTGGATRIGSIGATYDGRSIYTLTHNGVEAISIMSPDGSNTRPLTTGNDGIWLMPRVSSDGKSVVIASSRTGRKQLFGLDLDGQNVRQLTYSEDDVFNGKLLSDNKTVVFQSSGKDHIQALFKRSADGAVARLTNETTGPWDVSPDEKYLAYATADQRTHISRVFIISMETGWLYKTLDINPTWTIRWTRDGHSLTYDSRDGDKNEVLLQPIDGGPAKIIAKTTGEQIFSFDWSFDGKKISMIRGRQLNDAVQLRLTR